MVKEKEIVSYNKNRVNKSGLGPRDRQLKVYKDLGSDDSELKQQVLALRDELRSIQSTKNLNDTSVIDHKLYTAKEFNSELIKALDREVKQGTVGKNSVEYEKLKVEYQHVLTICEELKDENFQLEKELFEKDRDLTTLQAQVNNFDVLIASKNETIKSLKDKPIVLESSKPEVIYVKGNTNQVIADVNNESNPIDIEVATIDPTVNKKLESHLKIKEVEGTTSKEDMQDSLAKLRKLGL